MLASDHPGANSRLAPRLPERPSQERAVVGADDDGIAVLVGVLPAVVVAEPRPRTCQPAEGELLEAVDARRHRAGTAE